MAVTRANCETELVRRLKNLLTAAGMATTTAGGNEDLNGGIRQGLAALAITAANPLTVADADLAGVAADDLEKFFDCAELATLESIQGNLALVDITLGPRREALGQLAQQVEKMIERKRKYVSQTYGVGGATIDTGVINMDFAQEMEDE